MAMVPDASTAWVDPFYRHKTLSLICSIQEPRTSQPYDRCPRALAQRALDYLRGSGIADQAFFGPEPEFFLFDDVRYNSSEGGAFYSVDTIEAPWNSGRIEEGGADDGWSYSQSRCRLRGHPFAPHGVSREQGRAPTTPHQ